MGEHHSVWSEHNMIHRKTLLPAMIILLLLSSVVFAASDTTDARKDSVAIQVLEERIRGNAENTQIQVDGIQNEMRVRTEALEHRLDIYAGVAVLLLALLGWFGYKEVKDWAKERTEKMVATVFEESLTDFEKRTTEKIDRLIAEQNAKADKQRREFDLKAKELLGRISGGVVDRDKSEDVVVIGEISEYTEKLAKTKTKSQYSAIDWFLLAHQAHETGEFEEAVALNTKSIKLDPDNSWSYNNRGSALGQLGRYDEALRNYDKAIELDPKNTLAHNNRGGALCDLERYDEALKAYDEALEIDPEYISALKNAAEVGIVLGQYDDALTQASKALAISKNNEDKASSLYLKCIAEKLLGKDTSATEAEFDRVLKEEFETAWSSDEIEGWLEKAEISKEAREFIQTKTDMLKAKKKKQ